MKKIKKAIYNHIIPKVGKLFVNKTIIPIIYYHNVIESGPGYSFMNTEITVFEKHMRYLAENGYKTYTFDEISSRFQKDLNAKEVIITFDDGFQSNYTIAFPIMKELGLKFNIFLVGSYIESNAEDYLTGYMIKEMVKSNLVGFGAHTFSHIDSRKIDKENYIKEIELTNKIIKQYMGKDVTDFCFPYGFYNKIIINKLCKNRVYKRIYTSDYMNIRLVNDCEVIGRIPISNDYDIEAFKKNVEGNYNIMYYYFYFKGSYRKKL